MRTRVRVLRVTALSLVALIAACEAIVGDSLPSTIACSGNEPGICPTGQACVNGKCGPPSTQCVGAGCVILPHPDAGHDAGADVGHDGGQVGMDGPPPGMDSTTPEAAPPVDTGVDVPVTLGSIGDPCDVTACAQGLLCAQSTDLPNLGIASSVCSLACCTDADCMGGTCYPTAAGNLCVTQAAAAKCGAKGCGTSCCHDSDCTTDHESCVLGSSFAGSSVSACKSNDCEGPCGAGGATCEADSECQNGACADVESDDCLEGCECLPTCCNDNDCATMGGGNCQWGEYADASGSSAVLLVRTCAVGGPDMSGTGCTPGDAGATDCSGGICATFSSGGPMCTQPCCQDSDCSSINGGWICGPYGDEAGPDTTIVLLVCQPAPGRSP